MLIVYHSCTSVHLMVFGYLILTSIDFYMFSSCFLLSFSFRLRTYFKDWKLSLCISKHPEIYQIYFTVCHIFNSCLSDWKCKGTLSVILICLLNKNNCYAHLNQGVQYPNLIVGRMVLDLHLCDNDHTKITTHSLSKTTAVQKRDCNG